MTTVIETGADRAEPRNSNAFAVEIEGLAVQCGGDLVVRDLSMHVPRGAVYGLIGPSGAGKSVTIRVLATLQPLAGGTVHVAGVDLEDDPAAVRRFIGYLPDLAGVYDDLTVREYLDFYGALYQIPSRRRRQSNDELLELVGLTHQRNQPVRSLTRSMRQQLGLARCLVHDPSVLLLDEPAAGMDPQARLELRDVLLELARFGKTILISSHILSELAEVCSHLGFMRSGELVAEGEIEQIMRAVSPESRLRVQLLNQRDRDVVRALLESQPAFRHVEVRGGAELHAWFAGSRQDLAAVMEQLCTNGVTVTEFALEQPPLDDVFQLLTGTRLEA